METVVRIEGAVESALENMVAQGYFKTRAEAIRAGIMAVAKEYGAMPPAGSAKRQSGGSHAHVPVPDFGRKKR